MGFGFLFRKADLQAIGALPLMQLSRAAINAQVKHGGFADALKPFLQLVETPSTGGSPESHYDWIYYREL